MPFDCKEKAMMFNKYILLALLLIGWCALHSFLISSSLTDALKKGLGSGFRFYRLFFNGISTLTLIPVALYALSVRTEPFFQWHGFLRIFQLLILVVSLALFYFGARRYDIGRFMGLRQIQEGDANGGGISETGKLDTSGILSVVRHPWYLAGILIVWTRNLDVSTLVVNVIFCLYFVVGAHLEEKKLVREFGKQYLSYQDRVPMLFPYKILK